MQDKYNLTRSVTGEWHTKSQIFPLFLHSADKFSDTHFNSSTTCFRVRWWVQSLLRQFLAWNLSQSEGQHPYKYRCRRSSDELSWRCTQSCQEHCGSCCNSDWSWCITFSWSSIWHSCYKNCEDEDEVLEQLEGLRLLYSSVFSKGGHTLTKLNKWLLLMTCLNFQKFLFYDRIGADANTKMVAHLRLEQSTNSVKCLDQPKSHECLRVSVHLHWHFASSSYSVLWHSPFEQKCKGSELHGKGSWRIEILPTRISKEQHQLWQLSIAWKKELLLYCSSTPQHLQRTRNKNNIHYRRQIYPSCPKATLIQPFVSMCCILAKLLSLE